MENKRRIYALKDYPPEVKAVAFAKCSRSPEPFDIIAEELNEDKTRKFHEKWVVGYGHSSVAEHAVLSIAIENVSIIATKVIEDNRLASYTEKSTRYQVFTKDTVYRPNSIMNSQKAKLYEDTIAMLFETYNRLLPLMTDFFKKKYKKEAGQSDALYETIIKNKALDNLRCILPVATLTNLGMTINARQLEHAIVKMLTHPLKEIRQIGEEMKEASLKITPTLLKHLQPNKYLAETSRDMNEIAKALLKEKSNKAESVTLVEFDADAENKLVTALLYRFSGMPYAQIKENVKLMQRKEKEEVVDAALKKLGKFDHPLRELEHVEYVFDILMDYGSFRDVQRHRMVTQTNQEFTPEHGYYIPDEVIEADMEKDYRKAIEESKKAYEELKKVSPEEAQYIIPMAFNKRLLFKADLREMFHFIKLRSGKMGHDSYRKIAQKMYLLIKEKQPLMAKYIWCEMD